MSKPSIDQNKQNRLNNGQKQLLPIKILQEEDDIKGKPVYKQTKQTKQTMVINVRNGNKVDCTMTEKSEEKTDPLYEILLKLPDEVKIAADRAAQEVWKDERVNLVRVMAGLIGISIEELEQRLLKLPNRKGRPKRRKNPWHELFTNEH